MSARRASIPCPHCGADAKRLFITACGYVKKKRVSDVWKEHGIDAGGGESSDRKQRNNERIKKMREQDRIKKDQEKGKKHF